MIGMSYIHQTARRTENYADLTTGAHTQTIKSFWHIYKMQNKRQYGTGSILVDKYLCELVRRQEYRNTGRELLTTCTNFTLLSKTDYKGIIYTSCTSFLVVGVNLLAGLNWKRSVITK